MHINFVLLKNIHASNAQRYTQLSCGMTIINVDVSLIKKTNLESPKIREDFLDRLTGYSSKISEKTLYYQV